MRILLPAINTGHWQQLSFFLFSKIAIPQKGKWTAPGRSAIPGQSVERVKQASSRSPMHKNTFDRKGWQIVNLSAIKLIRTDTTLDLSQKAEKR